MLRWAHRGTRAKACVQQQREREALPGGVERRQNPPRVDGAQLQGRLGLAGSLPVRPSRSIYV